MLVNNRQVVLDVNPKSNSKFDVNPKSEYDGK